MRTEENAFNYIIIKNKKKYTYIKQKTAYKEVK